MKTCSRCKVSKLLDEFNKFTRSPDGHHYWCRECYRQYYRERKAHQAKVQRAWYQENRESRAASIKAWQQANQDKVNAYARQWQRQNRDRCRVFESLRYVRLRGAPTLPFTPDQLNARWDYYGRKCWICRSAEATATDHVKPLAKGGWHALSNLRPICRPCNSRKRDRWPYQRPPLLEGTS